MLENLKIDNSWTLFLDRDGVINKKLINRYVQNWSEFEFLPGSIEAIRKFNQMIPRIVIVTNQQGIGKGLMGERDLDLIMRKMCEGLSEKNARIDAWFHCPHLHFLNCHCRKPNTGMLMKAKYHFPEINLNHSIMVGDAASDMLMARRANMKAIYIGKLDKLLKAHPDLEVDAAFESLWHFSEEFIEE